MNTHARGAAGPEVDHAPAKLAVVDQEFDAGGIAVAGVETRRVEDRRAGVLFAKAEVSREREGIEPSKLLELRQDEAGVPVELHRLAFDAGDELKVFG